MILIREGVALISSILALALSYWIFGPFIDQVMAGYVMDALVAPGATALAINANSLLRTNDIIKMGIKVFPWMIIFACFFRFFIFVGFKTEETGVNF